MANENNQNQQNQTSELVVRREKLAALVEAGNNPFEITKYTRTHTSKEISENCTTEERTVSVRGEEKQVTALISPLDGQNVTVAGRIMSKRGMGKVGFVHIADTEGQIQLFVKIQQVLALALRVYLMCHSKNGYPNNPNQIVQVL